MSTPCTQGDNISELKTQQALNNQSLVTMNDKLDSIETKLDKFIESAEQKFAGKWIEKIFIFIMSIVGTAIIGGILALILK
jgi:hypothetical protein